MFVNFIKVLPEKCKCLQYSFNWSLENFGVETNVKLCWEAGYLIWGHIFLKSANSTSLLKWFSLILLKKQKTSKSTKIRNYSEFFLFSSK